jgi:hypothetical protein
MKVRQGWRCKVQSEVGAARPDRDNLRRHVDDLTDLSPGAERGDEELGRFRLLGLVGEGVNGQGCTRPTTA